MLSNQDEFKKFGSTLKQITCKDMSVSREKCNAYIKREEWFLLFTTKYRLINLFKTENRTTPL